MRSFTLASLAAATVSSHMMDIVANGNRGEHEHDTGYLYYWDWENGV